MIYARFECGGCGAKADGTSLIRRTFESLNGKGYGFGSVRTQSVEDVAPPGWVAFDPYTYATYCPKCWAEIEQGIAANTEGASPSETQGDPS